MNPIFLFNAFHFRKAKEGHAIGLGSKIALSYAFLLFFASVSFAQPTRKFITKTIWDLPKIPDRQVDIGLWSLIIAKYQNPELDIPHYLGMIDKWTHVIDAGIQNRSKDAHIVFAANYVLFKKGPWNDHLPVSYDLGDPMGDIIENRFLPSYLDRRLGNCITMPTLLLAIIERIDPGIPISAAYAPMHIYCTFQDRTTGKKWNVETTNGMDARDSYLIESLRIPKKGIENGIYMQPLSKKEFLAGLIVTLARYELGRKNYQTAVDIIDLSLKLHPKSSVAMATKGSILHQFGWDTLIQPINEEKRDPTPREQHEIERLDKEGNLYLEKAKKLGWEPESKGDRTRYLEIIAEAKRES